MSQTNSWDHADHAALVLEFLELTKPILQYWAIPTIAGLILKHGLDNETPLRKLLQDWNGIVKTLTDEQKTSLEAACPGIVARMTENLKQYVLIQHLRDLSQRSAQSRASAISSLVHHQDEDVLRHCFARDIGLEQDKARSADVPVREGGLRGTLFPFFFLPFPVLTCVFV